MQVTQHIGNMGQSRHVCSRNARQRLVSNLYVRSVNVYCAYGSAPAYVKVDQAARQVTCYSVAPRRGKHELQQGWAEACDQVMVKTLLEIICCCYNSSGILGPCMPWLRRHNMFQTRWVNQ
jgi:hypothetical protein